MTSNDEDIEESVAHLLQTRRGHFRLESGHHGDLWPDLEALCLRPEPVELLASELVTRIAAHDVEVVCGPLVEGAFVALMVASQLGLPFTYAERLAEGQGEGLYPVRYALPGALRNEVRGRRVAVVTDVVNAGSAVRGTLADLAECGGRTVAIGALATLGDSASRFAADAGVALEALASFPNEVWTPAECPLCGRGVPLDR